MCRRARGIALLCRGMPEFGRKGGGMKRRIWRHGKGKLSSIISLAVPYACILAVMALSVFWLGNQTLSGYRAAVVKEKEKSVQLAFDQFLKRAEELQAVSRYVAQNEILEEYFLDGVRKRGHPVVQQQKVREMLSDILAVTDVQYAYLYDVQEGRVISNDLALSDSEAFYRFKYRIEGYEAGEEPVYALRMAVGYNPVTEISINGYPDGRLLEYKSMVPLNSYGLRGDQLILVLAAGDVFRNLEEALGEDGAFYVYGGETMQLLYRSADRYPDDGAQMTGQLARIERKDAGEDVYGMECGSPTGPWRVRFYMASSCLAWDEHGTPLSLFSAILLPFVFGMACCVYFTYHNYKEILDILGLFRTEGEDAAEEPRTGQLREPEKAEETGEAVSYQLVRKYVDRMISENNRFRKDTKSSAGARKYEALDRLLRHNYGNCQEMEQLIGSVNWNIRQENCAVLCIHYQGDSYRFQITEQLTVKDLLREMLKEITDRNVEVFEASARETVCLFSLDDANEWTQVAEDTVSGILVKIFYDYGIEAEFGAGEVAATLYGIDEAYRQAREVIRRNRTSHEKFLVYGEMMRCAGQPERAVYYPPDTDEKIFNYVTAGYPSRAKAILREIVQRNFGVSENGGTCFEPSGRDEANDAGPESTEQIFDVSRRRPAGQDAVEVLGRLWEAVRKVAARYGEFPDLEEILLKEKAHLEKMDPGKCLDSLCRAVDILTAQIDQKKKTVQNQSASRILEYVKENYRDNGISVRQISLELGFHETYVSNLFKEVYGTNISDMIEKLRMEKACEFFRDPQRTIREIAESVGYTSEASFRRAFKKIYGVPPGEYRQRQK